MRGLVSRRSFVFLATGLVLAGDRALSQEKPEFIDKDALSGIAVRLFGATKELSERFADRAEREWIAQLDGDANRLIDLLSKVQVSKFYGEMLDYDAVTLGKAVAEKDTDKATDYIRISHDDIKIKLWGFELQLQWGAESSDISVEVDTITAYSKKPVNGLSIQFHMLGTGDSGAPFKVFNKLTTPTQDFVPPGRYIVHVRNAKNELKLKNTYTILGRQPTEKVEIGIP